MKTPSKIVPFFVFLAGIFTLATFPALTSAEGYSSGGKHSAHRGSMPHCQGKFRHGGNNHHHMQMRDWHGPERMARHLSVLETEIGIRANQLDAWRDFTDALLAIMKQPQPPVVQTRSEDATNEPFVRAQRFAEMAIARGEAGEDLLQAIEALRGTLTAEQLARVSEIESRMRGHHHRPSQPRPGPDEPEEGETDNAPDSQDDPDTEDDSESAPDAN